jgi:hypothetical protein
MTTPKHPQLTVTMTMEQLTTLRQALHALRGTALTIAATEKEFSRGRGEWLAAEYRAMENEARIDSAARAIDAAILPLNEWEALTDDLEAVRAMKSENERLAGAVLPSMKGGRDFKLQDYKNPVARALMDGAEIAWAENEVKHGRMIKGISDDRQKSVIYYADQVALAALEGGRHE